MWTFFHKLASPPHFYRISPAFIWGFAAAGLAMIAFGSYGGLFEAPIDYQQKDAFRIIYVHVPAAYLSMMAYSIMAISAAIGLIWRMKLAHAVAAAAAPLGAWFTFLALATGSIWGRPMWGTWWEWGDPRLTSELLMLFLYFGYMALRSAIDDLARADRASAVLALVGAVNIPVIHYSVEWWTSLHQGQTVVAGKMPPEMLQPLLWNILGFTLLFGAMILYRVRSEVLQRERRARWLADLLAERSAVPDSTLKYGTAALIGCILVPAVSVLAAVLCKNTVMQSFGGYGPYVSSSFVLTVNVVLIAALLGYRRHTRTLREISLQIAATEKTK